MESDPGFSSPDFAPSKNKDLYRWVLFLNPPTSSIVGEWFLKPVASVPLLLRNILTIQRAGLRELIVYHPSLKDNRILIDAVMSDSRLNIKIDWIHDSDELVEKLKEAELCLFVEGSAFHSPNKLKHAYLQTDSMAALSTVSNSNHTLGAAFESISQNASFQNLLNEHRMRHFSLSEDQQISVPEDFSRMTDRLLAECGLSNDSFLDRTVTRQISRHLTSFFLKTSWTPNQITGLSFLIGLLSAAFFIQGGYVFGLIGAALLQISAWVDCVDGEVARIKFQESAIGSQLDLISDNLVHLAVFFTIGMGLYFENQEIKFMGFGGLACFGSLLSFILLEKTIRENKQKAATNKIKSINFTDQIANRDFTYILLIFAALGHLDFFIALSAVGSNTFACYLLFSRFK